MIHVKMFNMFNEDERKSYEALLNQNYLDKTIRVIDLKHHSDREGVLFIYMVYADVETKRNRTVEYSNGDFPAAFQDEAMFQLDQELRQLAQQGGSAAGPVQGESHDLSLDPTAPLPATFMFHPQKKG